MLVLLADYS